MPLVLIAGFLIIVVCGWVYHHASQANRDLALERLARRLGMSFRSALPAGLKEVLPRFRAIEKAADRGDEFSAGINSITGSWHGRRMAFFDYQWVKVVPYRIRRSRWFGGGDADSDFRRTERRSAVAVELGVGLQPVLIRPERLVDKALALVGYEDIDFAHLPEFSEAFYVNSPDEAAARRLVTRALAGFFIVHVRCTVDVVGPWMLLHQDRELPAGEVQDLMDLAGRLSERVTREQSRLR